MTLEELKQKSVIELKAIVYDLLAQQEQSQREIVALNQLIAEKSQLAPPKIVAKKA